MVVCESEQPAKGRRERGAGAVARVVCGARRTGLSLKAGNVGGEGRAPVRGKGCVPPAAARDGGGSPLPHPTLCGRRRSKQRGRRGTALLLFSQARPTVQPANWGSVASEPQLLRSACEADSSASAMRAEPAAAHAPPRDRPCRLATDPLCALGADHTRARTCRKTASHLERERHAHAHTRTRVIHR